MTNWISCCCRALRTALRMPSLIGFKGSRGVSLNERWQHQMERMPRQQPGSSAQDKGAKPLSELPNCRPSTPQPAHCVCLLQTLHPPCTPRIAGAAAPSLPQTVHCPHKQPIPKGKKDLACLHISEVDGGVNAQQEHAWLVQGGGVHLSVAVQPRVGIREPAQRGCNHQHMQVDQVMSMLI